jgi:hypothetical protein
LDDCVSTARWLADHAADAPRRGDRLTPSHGGWIKAVNTVERQSVSVFDIRSGASFTSAGATGLA